MLPGFGNLDPITTADSSSPGFPVDSSVLRTCVKNLKSSPVGVICFKQLQGTSITERRSPSCWPLSGEIPGQLIFPVVEALNSPTVNVLTFSFAVSGAGCGAANSFSSNKSNANQDTLVSSSFGLLGSSFLIAVRSHGKVLRLKTIWGKALSNRPDCQPAERP